ncbi:MAG: S-layer homology domain-containing protein [Schaedlerella sp.]|nr:S-layer homology domain-containing protein [Lachnospiraceae bacterium]MDY4202933.1 S-layer homology domain-containing protein [Schaedlerella sp.]
MKRRAVKKGLAGLLAVVLAAGSFSVTGGAGTVLADKEDDSQSIAKNSAPVLSGTSYVQIETGTTFDEKNILNRVFAMDKEDGDLTEAIQVVSNSVNTSEAGTYSVTYSVSDSQGAQDSLTTTVEVVDGFGTDGQKIQKTLYTKESAEYLIAAQTYRGYYHDRQNLGIYLNSGAVLKIRIVNPGEFGNSLWLDLMTDDSHYGAGGDCTTQVFEIPSDGSTLTITAGAILDNEGNPTGEYLYNYTSEGGKIQVTDVPADSVAFIRTPESKVEPVVEYYFDDTGMEELTYYHHGDNQDQFLQTWDQNTQDYAVIEGERETILLPRRDRNLLFCASKVEEYNFKSLDDMLEFYDDMQDQYDRYLGVSYNAADPVDENVRARFFVKADLHGAGAAYYTGGQYTAQNGNSLSGFLSKGWMFLHEFAHGYEGGLAYGDLALVEVFNNIMAHYYEREMLVEGDDGWSSLQNLAKVESVYVADRENGVDFSSREFDARLYVFVNLLNKIGAEQAMARLHHDWRAARGQASSTTDFIVEHLSDYCGYNLVPYFEKCGASVSERAKSRIYAKQYPIMDYLGDYFTSDSDAREAAGTLGTSMIYSLVDNEELSATGKKGNLNIKITIDNLDEIKGKTVALMDGRKTVASEIIEGSTVFFADVPAGSYTLSLPIPATRTYYSNPTTVAVIAGSTAEAEGVYYKADGGLFSDDMQISLLGISDWEFSVISYDSEFGKIAVETNAGEPHYLIKDEYASVEILNPGGTQIFQKSYIGTQNYEQGISEIEAPVGTIIRVRHCEASFRVKTLSKYFNHEEYEGFTEEEKGKDYLEFVVTDYGLIRAGFDSEQLDNARESVFLKYIASVDSEMTDEQKNDPTIYQKEKAILVSVATSMDEEFQAQIRASYPYLFTEDVPVVKTDISECTVTLSESEYIYDGKSKTPEVIVKDGEKTLEKGTDYTVSYDDNTEVGTGTVTVEGTGNYTGTVSKTFTIKEAPADQPIVTPPTENPFDDVSDQDWFYDNVMDVYEKNLMTGKSTTRFAPSEELVRAQFAVILYRMEGSPEVTYSGIFPDVPEGQFYTEAVIWASENGIITGYTSTGTFGPNDRITREQMATMMYRYAKYKGYDIETDSSYISSFADCNQVQAYANDGMSWCVKNQIITGDGKTGLLLPQGDTVRAVCATIISRFTEKISD